MTVPGRPDTSPRPMRTRRTPLPADVTAAALDAIRRRGVDAFTVADVAQRTQWEAATIRENWGDNAELAVRALSVQWEQQVPLPDTGSVREDLAQWTRCIARYLNTSAGRSFMRLLVVDERNWGCGDARAEFWEARYQRVDARFERAKRRGEIRPGFDGNLAARLMMAPLHTFALYFEDAVIEEDAVNAYIDLAWNGIAAAVRP
jgi:AcrR family transcriptional regulator